MNNDMLHQKIVEEYKKNGSVGYTAELLGTNKTKVRRVLITYGLWSSKTTREVAALRDQGLSTKAIIEYNHKLFKGIVERVAVEENTLTFEIKSGIVLTEVIAWN